MTALLPQDMRAKMGGSTKGGVAGWPGALGAPCWPGRVGRHVPRKTVPGRTRPGPGGRPLAVRLAGGTQEGCGNGGKGTLPHRLSSPEHFWSPCSETGGTTEQGHGLADAGVGPMGVGLPLRRGLSGVKAESVGSKCLLPRESLALASGDKASWKQGSGTICSSDSTSPGRLWFPHRCVFMLINQLRVLPHFCMPPVILQPGGAAPTGRSVGHTADGAP